MPSFGVGRRGGTTRHGVKRGGGIFSKFPVGKVVSFIKDAAPGVIEQAGKHFGGKGVPRVSAAPPKSKDAAAVVPASQVMSRLLAKRK